MCRVTGFGVAGLRIASIEILTLRDQPWCDGYGVEDYTSKASKLGTQFLVCSDKLTFKHAGRHRHIPLAQTHAECRYVD